MTSLPVSGTTRIPQIKVSPEAISKGRVVVILSITVFIALAMYYVVGVDQGMTALFGKSMVIHEFVHDSRHFLGFPCH